MSQYRSPADVCRATWPRLSAIIDLQVQDHPEPEVVWGDSLHLAQAADAIGCLSELTQAITQQPCMWPQLCLHSRLAVERLIHNPLLLIDLLNHNQSQEIWGEQGLKLTGNNRAVTLI